MSENHISLSIEKHPVKHCWKGRGGFLPIAIVEHMMQGSLEDTWQYFNGSHPDGRYEKSAHYGIARDGRVWQFVEDEDTAWANGVLQAPDTTIDWLKEVSEEQVNANLVTLAIEYEGYSGQPLTEPQLEAALLLHRQLLSRWEIEPDDNHIIGHNRLDSLERGSNPGPAFPWEELLTGLNYSTPLEDIAPEPDFALPAISPEIMAQPSELEMTAATLPDLSDDEVSEATFAPEASEQEAVVAPPELLPFADAIFATPPEHVASVENEESEENEAEDGKAEDGLPDFLSGAISPAVESPAYSRLEAFQDYETNPADFLKDEATGLPDFPDFGIAEIPDFGQQSDLPDFLKAADEKVSDDSDIPDFLKTQMEAPTNTGLPDFLKEAEPEFMATEPAPPAKPVLRTDGNGLPDFMDENIPSDDELPDFLQGDLLDIPTSEAVPRFLDDDVPDFLKDETNAAKAEVNDNLAEDFFKIGELPAFLEEESPKELYLETVEDVPPPLNFDLPELPTMRLETPPQAEPLPEFPAMTAEPFDLDNLEIPDFPLNPTANSDSAAPILGYTGTLDYEEINLDMPEEFELDLPPLPEAGAIGENLLTSEFASPLNETPTTMSFPPTRPFSNSFDPPPPDLGQFQASESLPAFALPDFDLPELPDDMSAQEAELPDFASLPAIPGFDLPDLPELEPSYELPPIPAELGAAALPEIPAPLAETSLANEETEDKSLDTPETIHWAGIDGGVVAVELANVRSRPSYESETVLRQVEFGERLHFDGWTEGPELRGSTRWYHIKQASGGGWVHSSLVQLDTPFEEAVG